MSRKIVGVFFGGVASNALVSRVNETIVGHVSKKPKHHFAGMNSHRQELPDFLFDTETLDRRFFECQR